MSLFPEKEYRTYGMFGYESEMVHMAMRDDSPPMMAEAIERGWVDSTTRTLANDSLRRSCAMRGAKKCETYLAGEGFPQ